MINYRKLLVVIGCLMLIIIGCEKEKVDPGFKIEGTWIQVTDSENKVELLFNELNDMIITYANGVSITLKYRFSKPDELELFPPFQFPKGLGTKHRVEYFDATGELKIYQMVSSSQQTPQDITFIRK